MKKKILLPTDFSMNAWNAIKYAIELYKNQQCEFYILNTFNATGYALDSMMVPEPGERIYEELKEKSDKGLAKILERLGMREENPNHEYIPISQFNTLLEAIRDTVEMKDIEMIVMGTQGATNASNVIYGSNTVLVMEKIRNCPVLAIPKEVSFKEPKEIVFPSSLKTHVKRRELDFLIDIAKYNNSSIRVLHVTDKEKLTPEQENNKQLLEEYFDGLEYSFHTLHNIDIKSALSCFVESRQSDMITFINKKHTFFGSILSRPMVKDLGYHSKIPVLALHDLRN
ncbi:universal stress protein [Aquimarina intermedia]|uniref:Nucleotide-binding universal stress UspA family protein n=1 Tax=Aquimarina intermedia TaxID=350814 RepID=A0A5S5C499_9FLAO|nr:universal stress protein [Aquimarina intermedia]TYP74255.1 nucleotide-binding universal stress UspA family protein [Aquimarina intermedia]